jgi:membrane protease YdiL (CAAX protease family)
MIAGGPCSPVATPARRAEAMIALSVLALTTFYYAARADSLGVLSTAGVWSPVVERALDPRSHFIAGFLLLGLAPVLAARRILGTRFSGLGLGLGDWRRGLAWLAAGVPVALLAGCIASRSTAMQAVYPLDRAVVPDPSAFTPYAALQFLYYGSWEVLFRGVLLFGLRSSLGSGRANMLQTALSVTAHFGRPIDETLAALPAGLLFGWIDLRVGSIWYVAIIHWLVGVSADWFLAS